MDLLAKKRMLFSLMGGFFILSCGLARPDEFTGVYGLSGIDFFKARDRERGTPFSSDELWSEVRFLPGGGIEVYRPPLPVLEFLEAPSLNTGRRYLKWNELRLEKIEEAQEVLKNLS